MTLKEVLNSDLSTVSAWLREGLHWWLDELLQMVPPGWKARLATRRRRAAWTDGTGLYQADAGTPRTRLAKPAHLVQMDVELTGNLVLTRILDLPVMGMADVRRLVALEIDRLTPFTNANAIVASEMLSRSAQGQSVRLGVLPAASAEALMAQLSDMHVSPSTLKLAESGLDFLPAIRARDGSFSVVGRARLLWILVGVLMAINVIALSVQDANRLDALRDIVASQRPTVLVARRLQNRIAEENSRRQDIMAARAQASLLNVLNQASASLPAPAWVQNLEWDGRQLHISGYAPRAMDAAAALRNTPALRDAKSLLPRSAGNAPIAPFEVSATLHSGRAP